MLTRDLDLENGQADLSLTATPDMAGTVDISAFLFGRDARPVGDHRLIFVQPADELQIQTVADAPVYKPGGEAQIRFRVTNSRGAGVHAALGLQVVDEAVFALAEKQPGFAKAFFYLEQEAMKPRYQIRSLSVPDIVQPVESSQVEQRDRAARALFSATEIVNPNKFDASYGGEVPMTKQAEYASRYRARYWAQVQRLAERLSRAYEQNSEAGDLTKVFAKVKKAGGPDLRDAWGTELRLEPVNGDRSKSYYLVDSAGADERFGTADDMNVVVEAQTGNVFTGGQTGGHIALHTEHARGPLNGLADVTGTVTDPTGAVVAAASVEVRQVSTGKIRRDRTNASGQFNLAGVPAGEYRVQVSAPGFKVATCRSLA